MASPQIEEGAVHVALSLAVAIMQARFDGLERSVLDAVMLLTYARGMSKSKMDLEDLRLMVGSYEAIRPNRIARALEDLLEKNVLFKQETDNGYLLGIQKDFDKWQLDLVKHAVKQIPDKMSALKTVYINTNTKYSSTLADILSAPQYRITGYAFEKLGIVYKLSTGSRPGNFEIEASRARKLIQLAIPRMGTPVEAYYALQDYIDQQLQDKWFVANIRYPMGYAYTRFPQWLRQIPPKGRLTLEEEKATGYRYRYSFNTKKYERSLEKLNV